MQRCRCRLFDFTGTLLQRGSIIGVSTQKTDSETGGGSPSSSRVSRPSRHGAAYSSPASSSPIPPVDFNRPEPTFKELCGLVSSPNSPSSNAVKAVFDASPPEWSSSKDALSVHELYQLQQQGGPPPRRGLLRQRRRRISADMEFVRLVQTSTTFNANRIGQDRCIDNQSKGTSPASRSLWEDEDSYAFWHPDAASSQRRPQPPTWAPHTSAAFKSAREAMAYPPGPRPPTLPADDTDTNSGSTPPVQPRPFPVFPSTDAIRTDYDCNTKMDTVEELGKHWFIDTKSGWCHLCEEPVGIMAAHHSGDRDHMCLHFFLILHAHMPMRSWGSAHAVLEAAQHVGPGPGRLMEGGSLYRHVSIAHTMEHLHTQTDAVRRAELHSLLLHLTRSPHQVITHALQGRAEVGVWYSGERMFRAELARKATQLFPPMAAGVITQFNHKCWGRTNLERTFDALNIAGILNAYGAPAPTEKDDKAYFMRSLFAVLMHAPITEGCSEVGIELARLARQRLVFEMIFMQTMQFMVKAQAAMKRLGYPTYEDLVALGLG